MADMMRRATDRSHPVFLDIPRPEMAKANVKNLDVPMRQQIGAAIARAIAMLSWSKKEAAAHVQAACGEPVDEAEFNRWLSGERRPQFDKLFAVEALRQPLIVCLSALAADVEVVTEIRFRRQA